MKTIVVTGGSGGIGGEICALFARSGYKVALIYNTNYDTAKTLSDTLGVSIFQADVACEQSVNNAFKQIRQSLGKISVLVNCAGVSVKNLFQLCSENDFDKIFGVNVKGVFNCSKAVISDMLDLGGGDIINISSIWSVRPASCEVLYSATKGAVNSLTISLADELKFSNIKVNAILPGFVDTKMNSGLSQEEIQDFLDENGLTKIVEPTEIAKKCLEMVNGSTTGQLCEIFGQ